VNRDLDPELPSAGPAAEPPWIVAGIYMNRRDPADPGRVIRTAVDPADGRQWHDLARHLVQGHGVHRRRSPGEDGQPEPALLRAGTAPPPGPRPGGPAATRPGRLRGGDPAREATVIPARPPAGPGGRQEAAAVPASAHPRLRAVPPPGQAAREGPR